MSAEMDALSRQMDRQSLAIDRHAAEIDAQSARMDSVAREMEVATRPMQGIRDEMARIGAHIEREASKADTRVRALIDDALARGLAMPVELH